MEDNLLIEGTWWKYKKTEEIGFITDVQNKKGLIIFRFFQSGHVGSFTNMEFLREFEIISSHPEDVPVKVDSIWKSNKTGDIVKVLIEPDASYPSVHYINLNDTTGHQGISRMDRAAFITKHTFLRDNDNDALYRHNKNPNTYLKVIETTKKQTCMGAIEYVKYRVIKGDSVEDGHECLIVIFHSCCHLLSLDPEKEWTVPTDSLRTIKVEDEETKERYDKMIRKDELIMENSKETYLKTDTSKLKDFGTGAKREDKTGKGRYDLIPGDVMSELEVFAWAEYFNNGSTTCSATDVSKSAYFDDWTNVELYYDFIVNVISYFFAKDHIECTDDCGEISYEVDWDIFRSGLYEMRKQLALHYEAGAVVHGVDNWKKGLPVYGSERGGCFLDSMRRHIDQALMGLTDEPHAVAALWNAFCAVWTLKNKPANTTNSSETKPEAPDKIADVPTVPYNVLKANMKNCVELLSKMLVDDKSTDLKFETREVYINLYMICVFLNSVLCYIHNDETRVCIERLISGIYDLINTNLPSVRRIFDNAKAEWVEGYDEVYGVCLGEPDKYTVLGMIDLCCRTGMKLMNDDHFCGRSISNGLLFELKEHLSKLIKE